MIRIVFVKRCSNLRLKLGHKICGNSLWWGGYWLWEFGTGFIAYCNYEDKSNGCNDDQIVNEIRISMSLGSVNR